jgi:hypothetical protein
MWLQSLRRRRRASQSSLSSPSTKGRLRAARPRDDSVAGMPDAPARSGCVSGCCLRSRVPSGRIPWDFKRANPTASSRLAVLHAFDVVIAPPPRLHRDDNAGTAPGVPRSRHRATERSNPARPLISPPADPAHRQTARFGVGWHQMEDHLLAHLQTSPFTNFSRWPPLAAHKVL